MKSVSVWFIVALLFCSSLHADESGVQKLLAQRLQNDPTHLTLIGSDFRVDALIQFLQTQCGLPVCFENRDLDPKVDGISAKERYDELTSRSNLTPIEKAQLINVSELIKTSPQMNMDWKEARFQVNDSNTSPLIIASDILKQLSQHYTIQCVDSYIVILPKEGSVLTATVNRLDLDNATLGDAMKQLQPVFNKVSVGFCEMSIGPPRPSVYSTTINHLHLRNVSLLQALTEIGRATDPNSWWDLAGMKGGRMLQYYLIDNDHR